MIFHFLRPKNDFLCEASTNNMCKMAPIQFSHKVVHILWIIHNCEEFSRFITNFAHLYDFMSIFRKYFQFDLQVCDGLI